MRNGTPELSSFKRALALLDLVLDDAGQSNVSVIAGKAAIPVSTAHRQIASLVSIGYLTPLGEGHHAAGPRLRRLAQSLDEKQIVAQLAEAPLRRMASWAGGVCQFGTLENDMVTYRIKTGPRADALFTRTGMQLEAYCSGIGKVLLAFLPDPLRDAYLTNGPFIALTERTITDPAQLRAALVAVQLQGYAIDDREVAPDLRCIAVPIRWPGGAVGAAISVSCSTLAVPRRKDEDVTDRMIAAAAEIERAAFPSSNPTSQHR